MLSASQVVVAAQTVASESYGQNKTINAASVKEIKELAEAPDSWNYAITIGAKNTVTSVVFTDGTTTVTYTKTPADGRKPMSWKVLQLAAVRLRLAPMKLFLRLIRNS